MEGNSISVKGWTLDPQDIRKIAEGIGISPEIPLPEVIVVGEDQDAYYQEAPQINVSKESPSGYFITLPEKFLKDVSEKTYTLGPRAREDLRHELVHYSDYLIGGHVGLEDTPYEHALKEIRVELRVRPSNMSKTLAQQVLGLAEDYGLSTEDALETVARAAMELGISRNIVSRMCGLVRQID